MPSIYDIKPRFQELLRPFLGSLVRAGVTANQVTVSALALSALAGLTILIWPAERWPILLIPAVLFVRMGLNAIDGMLAREFGMQSRLGAVLNELGDVISDSMLYLPFTMVPGVPPAAVILIVVLAIISEMAGVVSVQIGGERRYDGPMGKSDRAFVFGLIGFMLGLKVTTGAWLTVLLWTVVALLGLTILNRSWKALRIPAQ